MAPGLVIRAPDLKAGYPTDIWKIYDINKKIKSKDGATINRRDARVA